MPLYQSNPKLQHHLELPLIILFPLFLWVMWPLLRLICKEMIKFLSEKHHY